MKKLLVLVVSIVFLFMFATCDKYENPMSEVRDFYETPHQLRKMFVKEEEITTKEPARGSFSGGFFMFVGGASGEYKGSSEIKHKVTHVRFAYEIKDHTYAIVTLPLEKIRIRLVKDAVVPTGQFFFDEFAVDTVFMYQPINNNRGSKADLARRDLLDYYSPDAAFSKYLKYVVFTVRSEDWPQNINLPTGGFGQ